MRQGNYGHPTAASIFIEINIVSIQEEHHEKGNRYDFV